MPLDGTMYVLVRRQSGRSRSGSGGLLTACLFVYRSSSLLRIFGTRVGGVMLCTLILKDMIPVRSGITERRMLWVAMPTVFCKSGTSVYAV